MITDSMPLRDGSEGKARRRMVFDPTINLGHILTFAGFMIAGALSYQTLERRQTVQETRFEMAEEKSREQDARMREALTDLRMDFKEMRRSFEDLVRASPQFANQREKK